jgi:hypothetical protein
MKEMTKKFYYPLFTLMVALSMAVAALAQGGSTTIKNAYLVDVACSTKVKDNAGAEAHSGSKGCATKEGCGKSGLGMFHDGMYIKFDAKGTELAKAALAKASKETGAVFTVKGKKDGDVFHATEITENHE